MEESASERWCHAFAISTGELIFCPIDAVSRKSTSLDTMDASAAHSAMPPTAETAGDRRAWTAEAPKEAPAPTRSAPMASDATDSKRPCP